MNDQPLPGFDERPAVRPRRLVFGVPRSPDEMRADRRAARERKLVGALRMLHGPGPEGARCGGCTNLYAHGGARRKYWKCRLGPFSHGPATDWRHQWAACGKFTPREK